jgi:hypothetical protein
MSHEWTSLSKTNTFFERTKLIDVKTKILIEIYNSKDVLCIKTPVIWIVDKR